MARMPFDRSVGWTGVLAGVVLLSGCGKRDAVAYANWGAPESPYVPSGGSSNAFDGYAEAAQQAESDAPKQLIRVSFTPGQKHAAIEDSRRALATLRRAAGRSCTFEFRSLPPFVVPPYQRGWRLLGRVLAWNIQNAVAAEDFDKAVSDTVLATKFGFDLTGGGAMDASLGFAIVNDARKAIAPSLPRLGAGQLAALSAGIRRALDSKPPIDRVFENEHKNMLLAIQALQDCYRDNRWESLNRNLGPDAHDAVSYLQDLKPSKVADYFQGLAKEADAEVLYLNKAATQSAAERAKNAPPKFAGERPWKHFTRDFFLVGRPLLAMNDESLARTRLLALTAELTRLAKAAKAVPSSLSGFPADLATDPYSGAAFVYQAQGLDFTVYSVGDNFQDDGGETDDSYSEPDLTLEK